MKKITKFSRDSYASAQIRYCALCLGHCGDNEMLVKIISRHLEVRIYFEWKITREVT